MTIFPSKSICTEGHHLLGIVLPFRGCDVKMHREGFHCSCRKKPRTKCKHVKWVEMNILGVNKKDFKL